jgi:MtN3 and saliva related transmembrane protein
VSDTLALLAAAWGVLMGASPLLQIGRIVARRSSEDVSVSYFGVLFVGFMLWLAYGLSINNPALIVPNIVALVVGLVAIIVTLRFRGRPDDA